MQGGLENYKVGSKNNWRRRMWNQAVRRLRHKGVRISEARVLYLSGEQDLDRPVALSKGFDEANLFAVDRSKDVVASLRRRGVIAICGNFVHVFDNWPEHSPIDFCFADFCCNLNRQPLALVGEVLVYKRSSPVVAVNMMRGREIEFEWIRCFAHQVFGKSMPYLEKHRGAQLLLLQCIRTAYLLCVANELFEMGDGNWMDGLSRHPHVMLEAVSIISNAMAPYLSTYVAGRNYMDSVIFDWPFCTQEQRLENDIIAEDKVKNTRGRIAAALALSTRKKRGSRKAS